MAVYRQSLEHPSSTVAQSANTSQLLEVSVQVGDYTAQRQLDQRVVLEKGRTIAPVETDVAPGLLSVTLP
jgi:hypothetical protein